MSESTLRIGPPTTLDRLRSLRADLEALRPRCISQWVRSEIASNIRNLDLAITQLEQEAR